MIITTIKAIIVLGILTIALLNAVWRRLILPKDPLENLAAQIGGGIGQSGVHWASSDTRGSKEVQADRVQVLENEAGILAVLADGIGKANTGSLCAQIAADTLIDRYEPYHRLHNPSYFFQTVFREANRRILQTIGERRGGACLAAVYLDSECFYYAIAGNIRVALVRRGEIIPLSSGQTMGALAAGAYQQGQLSKQEMLWSLDANRAWNYLGKDGFHEVELCDPPIRHKPGDLLLLASCGIFEEVSWARLEDILIQDMTLQKKADTIVAIADAEPGQGKENGSVLLIQAEVVDEKDQF